MSVSWCTTRWDRWKVKGERWKRNVVTMKHSPWGAFRGTCWASCLDNCNPGSIVAFWTCLRLAAFSIRLSIFTEGVHAPRYCVCFDLLIHLYLIDSHSESSTAQLNRCKILPRHSPRSGLWSKGRFYKQARLTLWCVSILVLKICKYSKWDSLCFYGFLLSWSSGGRYLDGPSHHVFDQEITNAVHRLLLESNLGVDLFSQFRYTRPIR